MSEANKVQHGGDHYKAKIQHWDLMAASGFGWEYYLAAASKYTTRYHKTDKDGHSGELAVQKAIHYIEKLIELIAEHKVPAYFRTTQGLRLNLDPRPGDYNRCVNMQQLMAEYLDANNITSQHARAAIYGMLAASDVNDLAYARAELIGLLDEVTGKQPEAEPAPPTAAQTATLGAAAAAAAIGAGAGPNYVDQGGERFDGGAGI